MNPATTGFDLAVQQSDLLAALVQWPHLPDALSARSLPIQANTLAARGLHAYRANAHASAVAALQAAYPVLEQMLGEESFAALAKAFWHRHPPVRGDWACWGAMLSEFVADDEQLADVPWLADVARLEWDLHELATAADAQQQLHTMVRLTQDDPQNLTLHLAPQRPVWTSAWPVVTLWQAHPPASGAGELDATLFAQAQDQVERGTSQDVLVWRDGWRPKVREALSAEAGFLQALQTGASLLQAIESQPELDFAAWLQTAVETRLLLAVLPATPQMI